MKVNPANWDRSLWIAFGLEHGWLEHQCITHEGLSYTEEEQAGHEDGLDPCISRYVVIPAEVFGQDPDRGAAHS